MVLKYVELTSDAELMAVFFPFLFHGDRREPADYSIAGVFSSLKRGGFKRL